MQDAEELAEMRALQARAYGRDGDLSHAEAARLRALQTRAVERREDRVIGVAEPVAPEPAAAPEPAVAMTAQTAQDPVDEAPAAASAPAPRRPRVRWIALAAVATLLCGVGLGWLLFGQSRSEAVSLTSEQREWQNALLAEAEYDPSSVRALAVEEGVVVWAATKDGGRRTCLILGDGESTVPNCQLTEAVAGSGMVGSIIVDADGGSQREVTAQVLFAASGEPAVAVSSYDYSSGATGIIYANENETRIAEKLADEGFDPHSIWVVEATTATCRSGPPCRSIHPAHASSTTAPCLRPRWSAPTRRPSSNRGGARPERRRPADRRRDHVRVLADRSVVSRDHPGAR